MNETIFEQVEAFASVLKLDLSAGFLLPQRKKAADYDPDTPENEPPSHKGTQNL